MEPLHNYTFVWFITQESCDCVCTDDWHRFPVATILRFLWRCLEHDPVPMHLLTEHTAFDVALYQGTCSKLSTRWCTVDFHKHWNTKNLSSKFAKLLKWFLYCIGVQHKKKVLFYRVQHIQKQNQFMPQWKASMLGCINLADPRMLRTE